MELKRLPYKNPWNRDTAELVYVVDGKKVYYTGTRNRMSTINAAEVVIAAICKAEGINWQDYAFYDINCRSSYQGYGPGEYEVTLVELAKDKGSFAVAGFQVVDFSEGRMTLEGFVPEKMNPETMALFAPFIGKL